MPLFYLCRNYGRKICRCMIVRLVYYIGVKGKHDEKGFSMDINALVMYENHSDETTTIEKNFDSYEDADKWVKHKMFCIIMSCTDIKWIEGDWESAGGMGCNYSVTIG